LSGLLRGVVDREDAANQIISGDDPNSAASPASTAVIIGFANMR
jgi:hypothetical protein